MSYSFGHSIPYGVIFYGDTSQATGEVQRFKGEMDGLPIKYGEVATAAEMSGFRQLRAARMALFGVQMLLFYMSMWTSGMLRDESAIISVERAQRRYTEALREHGRGSREARDALDSLTQAQLYYQRSAAMSNIMNVAMSLQVISMSISFMQAIPAIRGMITTLKEYNIVAGISKALSGPWGWALLAGGIAAGAVGTYAITQMMQAPASQTRVDVKVIDEDIIRRYMRRIGGNDIKSSTG